MRNAQTTQQYPYQPMPQEKPRKARRPWWITLLIGLAIGGLRAYHDPNTNPQHASVNQAYAIYQQIDKDAAPIEHATDNATYERVIPIIRTDLTNLANVTNLPPKVAGARATYISAANRMLDDMPGCTPGTPTGCDALSIDVSQYDIANHAFVDAMNGK